MNTLFHASAVVSMVAGILVVTRRNPMHALVYLVLLFLAVALMLFTLGATFVAGLQVIVYAGAIMVLFLFVVMMLNIGEHATEVETEWLKPGVWAWPSALATVLIGELTYVVVHAGHPAGPMHVVTPKEIGRSLFGPYAIGVELASLLLMSGLVGAYHLGRRASREEEQYGTHTDGTRPMPVRGVVHAGSDRTSHAA